ncbi:MAG: FAD-dependent oxidoreductase [Candidatus Zixiibacteriota bacterium]|jgi:heterodisulfide reductase subunit A
MAKESSVLVYGTNLAGYRAAYALCKDGHKVVLLNRGRYVDEIKYQALAQLPLDFCWICGHMPQRLFKALGCLTDNYNAELLSVEGEAGGFKVKFKKKDQYVNNFACIECDKCVEVCPVEVDGRKAITVVPEAGWENIYVVDEEHCTKCGKCEEVCPTSCIKIERPEETVEADVGAIIVACEYESPTDEDLAAFGAGKSPAIVSNAEVAGRSLLTNFVKDAVRLPSGEVPAKFAIIVTPHFNGPGVEYENYNLSVTAAYRAAKIKELMPEAEITVFLSDYRGFGKGHYRQYLKAREAGVEFIRAEAVTAEPKGKGAVVKFKRGAKGEKYEAELVILVTGQKSPATMESITAVTGIKPDERGFCRLRSFSSTETEVPGVFCVGECSGVKGNPETVWEGCALLPEVSAYLGEKNFKPAPPPELRNVSGEVPNVGVFICSCHGTFSERMDLEALREQAAALGGVGHAEIVEGCCTPPTMKATAERIKESGVNRVVLAVCTPLQKLLKYRKTAMMAGLSPLLLRLVSLREDVIDAHDDPAGMQAKGLSLIRGAVEAAKRAYQEPLETDAFTPRALVVGGGLAGLAAAEGIAAGGFDVTLVDRGERPGGNPVGLDGEERAYLDELTKRVGENERITVHTGATPAAASGYAGNYNVRIETKDGDVVERFGIVVLATGAREYRPEGFGYGDDDRVMTQRELAEKLAAGEKPGGDVVMIQCVGSRIPERPYCSRVCCAQALRNALALSEGGAKVTVLYRDMVTYGAEDDLYRRAQKAGVKFSRFDEDAYPTVEAGKKGLTVKLADGEALAAKAVVLSVGVVPERENNEALSAMFGLPLDADGFFDSDANAFPFEEAIKRLTKPFELATNGVFAAGLAHSPRPFQGILLTARDAAGRAIVMLGKKKMPPPNAAFVAGVKDALCMGCGVCVDVCPYGARAIDVRKKVAFVRPFLCDSCGTCVAACPNDASFLRDFTGIQSIATLDAVLS